MTRVGEQAQPKPFRCLTIHGILNILRGHLRIALGRWKIKLMAFNRNRCRTYEARIDAIATYNIYVCTYAGHETWAMAKLCRLISRFSTIFTKISPWMKCLCISIGYNCCRNFRIFPFFFSAVHMYQLQSMVEKLKTIQMRTYSIPLFLNRPDDFYECALDNECKCGLLLLKSKALNCNWNIE